MNSLIIYKMPQLSNPCLVVGLGGWPNAGEDSTTTVAYLRDKSGARKFAEIKPEGFYDLSSLRPLAIIKDGSIKELRFPTNEFFFYKNEKSPHDLIIFLGTEPHLNWERYIDSIFEVVEKFGVKRIYTVGGTYDKVPHTREPIVSAAVSDDELKQELKGYGLEPIDYQGPSSFHSALLHTCMKRNIKAISLWGHAPHYIQVANTKVSYAVLKRLTRMLQVEIDLKDIMEASEFLENQVNRAVSQNPQLQEYVEGLEREYRATARYEEPLDTGEKIVKEVEEFLREQKKRGQG